MLIPKPHIAPKRGYMDATWAELRLGRAEQCCGINAITLYATHRQDEIQYSIHIQYIIQCIMYVLSTYACLHVGMHVRMVCMYVCTYVSYLRMHTYIRPSMHACMQCNAMQCNAMHACMHACRHACRDTYMCVHIYIFTVWTESSGLRCQRELRAKAHQKGLSDSRRDSIWWPWPSEGCVETPRTRTSLSDRSKTIQRRLLPAFLRLNSVSHRFACLPTI